MGQVAIFDCSKEDLIALLANAGFGSYKVKQLFSWLYKKQEFSLAAMSDLSKAFKDYLQANFDFSLMPLVGKQVSADGTIKLLFSCFDGEFVETVIMHHNYGTSLCVSSQIGCALACRFCASGLLKKVRDLSTEEMVLQVLQAQLIAGQRIDNVVVMGSGEPFDNYTTVIKFLNLINDDWGLAIGVRHLTVSTCGIVPKILQFAQERPYNLALSLHAANDELRDYLMPINRIYPLAEVKAALREYSLQKKRRLSLEYILIKGVNDQPEAVAEIKEFMRDLKNAYINLIPYNEVPEFDFRAVTDLVALKFYDLLKKAGIAVTLRNRKGDDIDAACGQLRNRAKKGEQV